MLVFRGKQISLMKKLILKNGLYATLVVVGIHVVFWIASDHENYTLGELVGYASMILSMSFVFLGMREYKLNEKNGTLSFTEGLKVGTLIALIPSAGFALYDLFYVKFLDPDFYKKYSANYLKELEEKLSKEEYIKAAADMEANMALFTNPAFQFLVMFATVFVIGFIISLISSIILRTKTSIQ